MKVQSFDNQSFQARNNDRNLGTYNPRRNPRANVDAIIALDDNSIKQLAYAKTLATVEDDKHRKITNAMFCSIPFVAGIATALLNPSKVSVLGKEISGVAARLANGAANAASWGVLLGLAGGINALVGKGEQKSPAFRKMTNDHPILTFVGQMAAFMGSVALGVKYIPKAVNGIAKHIKPSTIDSVADKIAKGADKLNNNKFTVKVAKSARRLADSKYFEPLKGVTKTLLSWSPSLLLWSGVIHSLDHSNKKEREYVNNYSKMKDFQSKLAQARIRELSDRENAIGHKMQAHQA